MSAYPQHYAEVFSRLKGVLPVGDGDWSAYCPGHANDGQRALRIKLSGSGRLMLSCMSARCPYQRILEGLGLDATAGFPPEQRPQQGGGSDRKFVEEYVYADEDFHPIYGVARWMRADGTKTFSAHRYNPAFDPKRPASADNPKWVKGIEGVRRVLYRLPQCLELRRKKPERWVFVVEGEKAVNYLSIQRGLIATCNPFGAGKWNDVGYSHALKGARVCVVADNDDVGRRHAHEVCLSLYGWASELRSFVAEGAEGAGLDDWVESQMHLGAGWVGRKLNEKIDAAGRWAPRPEDLPPPLRLCLGELHRLRCGRAEARGREAWYGAVRLALRRVEDALTADTPVSEWVAAEALRLLAAAADCPDFPAPSGS